MSTRAQPTGDDTDSRSPAPATTSETPRVTGALLNPTRWFTGLGLRYGTLRAWLSVLAESRAGALLGAGLRTSPACAAVIR